MDGLAQTVAFFAGELDLLSTPSRMDDLFERFSCDDVDLSEVRGEDSAKQAMTLAAAGHHKLIEVTGRYRP